MNFFLKVLFWQQWYVTFPTVLDVFKTPYVQKYPERGETISHMSVLFS